MLTSICNQSRLNLFMTFTSIWAWCNVFYHENRSSKMWILRFFIKFRTSINFHKCVETLNRVSYQAENFFEHFSFIEDSVINKILCSVWIFKHLQPEEGKKRKWGMKIGIFCRLKKKQTKHSLPPNVDLGKSNSFKNC